MADPWPGDRGLPRPDPGPPPVAAVPDGERAPTRPRAPDAAGDSGARVPGFDSVRTVAVWLLVAPLAVWLAVRVAGVGAGTRIETLLVFTPYVALVSVAVLLAAVALRAARAALVAAAACCLGYALVVAPLFATGPHPVVAPDGPAVRVMTVNVLYGGADPASVVDMVRDRDVAVLGVQELTPSFHARLLDEGLDDLLEHSAVELRTGSSGTGLYSRHRVEQAAHEVEGRHENPTVSVDIDGAPAVEVTVVHPVPPIGAGGRSGWRRTFADLPRPARPGGDGPVRLLVGDFNATVDQPTMRDLLDDGYVDAAGAAGRGWVPTWRTGLAPPLAIDHVLVDRTVGVGGVSVLDVPGSDHRAVVADLRLPSS